MSEVIALAQSLIARPSVAPADGGCQLLLAERLAAAGFAVEPMRFGEIDNLWARHGTAAPLLCLAGHTDVVPTGPLESWTSPPYDPVVRDGMLHGRGSADMKGAIAAMVVAAERFLAAHPQHQGSLAFLITGDEEGPSVDGTVKVVERLSARGDRIDWCVLGEPSSQHVLGDTLRNGRRGSLSALLKVKGVQGHVAYPDRAVNAIHRALPALLELTATHWDDGVGDPAAGGFPPTTFQISNLNAGHGTNNVIPGEATVRFNLRYSTAQDLGSLTARIEQVLRRHGVDFAIEWKDAGRPFLTSGNALIEAARDAVREVTGVVPRLDTGGGTSDGRFIAPTGAQVVELGPLNATIHQIDERVAVDDLERLAVVYERLLVRLLAPLIAAPRSRNRFRMRLRDSTRVTVRWVEPADKPRFKEGIVHFSAQTLYRRFFTPITALSDQQLRSFTEVDQVDHVAWGVLDDDHTEIPGIGVGRWVRSSEQRDIGECAVIVADAYQGRGIGTVLLAVLNLTAAKQGLRTLRSLVLAENTRFIATLAAYGGTVAHEHDGIMRVDMPVYARASQTPRTERGRVFGRTLSLVRERLRAAR